MASVNVPTNNKIKEKDVNAKLQLFGIYEGMSTLPWHANMRRASHPSSAHAELAHGAFR